MTTRLGWFPTKKRPGTGAITNSGHLQNNCPLFVWQNQGNLMQSVISVSNKLKLARSESNNKCPTKISLHALSWDIHFYYSNITFEGCFFKNLLQQHITLCIILSRDVPLLKSEFSSRSETLDGLLVAIFRAVENSNPQRYTCRQELMDF